MKFGANYIHNIRTEKKMDFADILSNLAEGFGLTLLLFAVTIVLAIPLGLLAGWLVYGRTRLNRWIEQGANP